MGRIVGDLKARTLAFSTNVLALMEQLPHEQRGWVVGKQLGRAATSIGANVWEADAALTASEFAYKISLARKEALETEYWFELVARTQLLPPGKCEPSLAEAKEMARILATIVRKTQQYLDRRPP